MNRNIQKKIVAGVLAVLTTCVSPQVVMAEPNGVVADDPSNISEGMESFGLRAEAVGCDWVSFTWDEVAGAQFYELQQSEDKENYTTVAVQNAGAELRYTVSGLYTSKTYYYRVVMTDANGVQSVSERVKVKPVLMKPEVIQFAENANKQVDIAWTQVEGAVFYRVYRSETATGGFKKIKTVYGTSYTDAVELNKTYYYKIMPLRYNPDGKKVRGKCSEVKSIMVAGERLEILSITNTKGNSLTLTWSEEKDAAGYAIYRSLKKTEGYELIAEVESTVQTWTDTSVAAGTKYFYKVCAASTATGSYVYGTPSLCKSKWTISDAPTSVTAVQNGTNGVTITWTAAQAATSYRVYRATGTSKVYKKIASKIKDCTYTDTNVTAGETYSYCIKAVHGSLVSEKSMTTDIEIGQIDVSSRTIFVGPGVSILVTAQSDYPGTLTWTSMDPSIATVSAEGVITGVAPGVTQVVATIDAVSTGITVNVTDAQINGIDVSKWQQAINWEKVRNSGIQFAMLRLTYGTSVDIQFENYYKGATEQDIKVGVYCYTRAKSVEEGIAEAENLVKLLDGRDLAYPVALDLEDELQIKNMNKEKRTQLILEYKRIIEEAGYDFVVYANLNWLNNYIDQSVLEEEGVDIWLARYRTQSLGPGYTGGGNVRIWQYSSTGQVDGILDAYGRYINVDLDVCYEDY